MTTIKTAEQAETLPVGTVLRLTSGQIYARIDTADDGADWQTIGDTYCWGAAEMLNEHPGPATVLHDPTQPAPAGVTDREAIARAAWSSYDGEQSWDELCDLAEQKPDADYAEIRDGYLGEADRILTILPTRTVAQVKAEAWDEGYYRGADLEMPQSNVVNPYRADEIEREDKR